MDVVRASRKAQLESRRLRADAQALRARLRAGQLAGRDIVAESRVVRAVVEAAQREEAGPEPLFPAAERERMDAEVKIAREVDSRVENILQYGQLSPFTCPECHGVLTLFRDGHIARFRCHTGHAVSAGSLLEASTEQVEQRLMDAMRALDEVIMLLNKMGEEHAGQGNTAAAEQCFNRAREAYERSRPIREAALANEELSTDDLRQAQG